ncbi:GNAT family N-acetyltransferase [Noviherbaspirillum sp. ST9]|uniref:GNAT family N-acetyltransferase n=1 Tax=Noviherbaspirillum sp. ST9 TaxID=3401606 RepID=UPI003B589B77
MSGATLRNNSEQQRYELLDNDEVVGIAEYKLDGDAVVFTHTEVGEGHEGKGYGSKLAKLALDDTVAAGRKIVARCEFIAGYLGRHPEYGAAVRID